MVQLATVRENFGRACLCFTGVIFEMLKYLVEIHLSPSRFERVTGKMKMRNLPAHISRFIFQTSKTGYRHMDFALIFWVMRNLMWKTLEDNFMTKTEELRKNLNLLYSRRFKKYLSKEEFENFTREMQTCEVMQKDFHLHEDFATKLSALISQHIDPKQQHCVIEEFVRCCRCDEGALLLNDSFTGEQFINLIFNFPINWVSTEQYKDNN